MLSSAPTVTTPVPPMPVTNTFHGSSIFGGVGRGRPSKSAASATIEAPVVLRSSPPITLTKLGQ